MYYESYGLLWWNWRGIMRTIYSVQWMECFIKGRQHIDGVGRLLVVIISSIFMKSPSEAETCTYKYNDDWFGPSWGKDIKLPKNF